MMNDFRCYTRDQLRDFLLGNLSAEVLTEISSHLDRCDACEDTIVGLENTADDLLKMLQHSQECDQAEAPVYDGNPEFREALLASQHLLDDLQPVGVGMSAPSQIGDYEIVSTLAKGGMGSVFKARHTRLEKDVAIKILPDRKMRSRDAIARFSREMKIIGQMSHPSMVSATDAGADKGIHYLVMELVDGIDLGKIVRRCGPMNVADACEMVRQSAVGIQYAHDQGVIHRDVKPSNLMLANDPLAQLTVVKVLDLGLATLGGLTGTVDELTTVGQLMGTLDYMSPEQCGNIHEVDAPADIYGLGATLYKLLTGVAPYSSPENDTPLKKLKAMAISQPIPIRERMTQVPDSLVEIIDRCLAREPADRFESAEELAIALQPLAVENDLTGLLTRAKKISCAPEFGTPDDSELLSIARQKQQKFSKTDSHRKSSGNPQTQSAGNRWIGNMVKALLMLAAFGLIAASGIIIYINTTTGQLVIESDVDGVEVTVLKNETPTKDLQIEHGSKTTRLRAGEYQVVIKGESDGLIIEDDKFILKRGDTVIARITRKKRDSGLKAGSSIAADSTGDPSDMNIHEFEKSNLFEKRLYRLELTKAGLFGDSIPADHPGLVEMNQLIEETKLSLEQGKTSEDFYTKDLFDKRLHRVNLTLMLVDQDSMHDMSRQIDSIRKFIRERKTNRNATQASQSALVAPAEVTKNKNVPTISSNSSAQSDKTTPSGPTYMGRDIIGWINDTLTAEQLNVSDEAKNGVKLLQQQLTPSQKQNVAEYFIEKYKNEVALEFHQKLVAMLSPLCESENVMALVFDHAVSIARRIDSQQLFGSEDVYAIHAFRSLRSVDAEAVLDRMVQLAKSDESSQQSLAVAYAKWLESSKALTTKLESKWIEPLVGSLESEDIPTRINASFVLAKQFPRVPAVINALEKAAKKDSSGQVLANCINILLDHRPNDKQLPKQLMELVENGHIAPSFLVADAVRRSDKGDSRVVDQIVAHLSGHSWAMTPSRERSSATSKNRSVSFFFTKRQLIIRAIGNHEHQLLFVPVLQKQFELEFDFPPESQSKMSLLTETNDSLAKLLGVTKHELYEGRSVEQWFDAFLDSADDETRRKSLVGLTKLQTFAQDPTKIVLTVIPKLRDISFLEFDDEDENSLPNVAVDFCLPIHRRSSYTRDGKRTTQITTTAVYYDALIENMDALEEQDAMFVLSILRREARNSNEIKPLYDLVLDYADSENRVIQRRAVSVLISMYDINSNQLTKIISSAFESEAFDDAMKIAVLQQCAFRDRGHGAYVNSNRIGEPVLDFLANIKDPRQIATILTFAGSCGPGLIEPLLVRLLAENGAYLNEVHQPYLLDIWNGKQLEPDAEAAPPSTETLFDTIIEIVDKATQTRNNKLMRPRRTERDAQTTLSLETAINNLELRKSKSDGASKRKLERILKVIAPKKTG